MSHRTVGILFCAVIWSCGQAPLAVFADDHSHGAELPAGPIRDRHELMEEIGRHAKAINRALEQDKPSTIGPDAEAIALRAQKIKDLFPPDSTHAKSRAKPEIWSQRAEFDRLTEEFVKVSNTLVAATKSGGDVKAAAKDVFGACKPCHEKFRLPEK